MLIEPIHTCGYVDGIILNIDGYYYALVEDGILPLETRNSKEKCKTLPLVLFGGKWYHLRDKGTYTYDTNDVNAQIRRYLDNEGRILQNGVKNLESLFTAFIEGQSRVSTLESISKDPKSGKSMEKVSENAIKDEEEEENSKEHNSDSGELHFDPNELMAVSKVVSILKEAAKSPFVCVALFGRPKIDLTKQTLRKTSRASTFWWAVVDIALALASAKLFNWVFSTILDWDEEFGPYFVLQFTPKKYPPTRFDNSWLNSSERVSGILKRFIGWWNYAESGRGVRDENNVYGSSLSSDALTYREENIVPLLKSLMHLSGYFGELYEVYEAAESLDLMTGSQWPCSAIECMIPHLKREDYLETSILQQELSKFALTSADRLIFAIKNFHYLPLATDVVRQLFKTQPTSNEISTRILPIIKTLASLATTGWCKILKA